MKKTFTVFKRLSLLLALLFTLNQLAYSQVNPFLHGYGGTFSDYIQCVKPTYDGGYLLSGSTATFGNIQFSLDQNIYLIKTDSIGNAQWTKTYWSGKNVEETVDVIPQNIDSTYYLLNNIRDSLVTNMNFGLSKIDHAGNMIWNKSYNFLGNSTFATTFKKVGSDFLVAGGVYENTDIFYDAFLAKIDSFGIVKWVKTFSTDTPYVDEAFQINITHDNNILLMGVSYYNVVHDYRALVIKTDMNGNLKWSKAYANSRNSRCVGGFEMPDGSYLFGAQATAYGPGGPDFMAFKTDSAGNVLWSKVYGDATPQFLSDIILTGEGVVMVGSTGTSTFDKTLLLKTDFNGNVLIANEYGDSTVSQDGKRCVQSRVGFAVAGVRIGVFNQGYSAEDFTLMKTDNNLNTSCLQSVFTVTTDTVNIPVASYTHIDSIVGGSSIIDFVFDTASGGNDTAICATIFSSVTQVDKQTTFKLYPNPSDGNITIEMGNSNDDKVSVMIYNPLGERVESSFLRPSAGTLHLQTNLAQGIYFYEIIPTSGNSVRGNFVIEK